MLTVTFHEKSPCTALSGRASYPFDAAPQQSLDLAPGKRCVHLPISRFSGLWCHVPWVRTPQVTHKRGTSTAHLPEQLAHECRMLFSVKALLFGEDFTTDPVSKAIAFCLRSFSRGHLVENLQMFSQVKLPLHCHDTWLMHTILAMLLYLHAHSNRGVATAAPYEEAGIFRSWQC